MAPQCPSGQLKLNSFIRHSESLEESATCCSRPILKLVHLSNRSSVDNDFVRFLFLVEITSRTRTPLGNRSARMVCASRDGSSRLFCAVLCQGLCTARVARLVSAAFAEATSHETEKSPRLVQRCGTGVCGVDHHSDSHSNVVSHPHLDLLRASPSTALCH